MRPVWSTAELPRNNGDRSDNAMDVLGLTESLRAIVFARKASIHFCQSVSDRKRIYINAVRRGIESAKVDLRHTCQTETPVSITSDLLA